MTNNPQSKYKKYAKSAILYFVIGIALGLVVGALT